MMSFWVYILRCSDDSYYTGHTDDLERRMAQYQVGEVTGYVSTRLPVKLMFSAEFSSREEALERERQIKGWSRKKKEAIIKGDWTELSRLSRPPFDKPVLSRPLSFDKLRTNGRVEGLRANG